MSLLSKSCSQLQRKHPAGNLSNASLLSQSCWRFVTICLLGVPVCSTGLVWSDPGTPEKVAAPRSDSSSKVDAKESDPKENSKAPDQTDPTPAKQVKANTTDPGAKNRESAKSSGENKSAEMKVPGGKAGAKKQSEKQTADNPGEEGPVEKDPSVKGKNRSGSKAAEKTGDVSHSKETGNPKVGGNSKAENSKPVNPKGGEFSAEHEAQALDFASKHHPELVGLISPLKMSNPKEYQRAVRELFRTSERLDNIRLREPARYDLELEAWKLNSNVRLLAARLVMEPEPELQQSLKDAIRKKADNRVRLMQFEKESLKGRLVQIDKDIEKSTKSLDQSVEQEYERLLKQSSRDKPAVPKMKKKEQNR
ncbi:MAG: hypothetical protein JWM11_2595 [Planctomycetaceae bacterium]|nr:hypothetical protein [Planctomycetaceae bacterium]